jgi:hypothetical protein
MNNLGIKRKDLYGKSNECKPCSPEQSKEDYDNQEVYPSLSVHNAAHAKALGLHILKAGKDYDLTVRVRLGDVHIGEDGLPSSGSLQVRAIEGFEEEAEETEAPSIVKALRRQKSTS